MLLCQMQWYCSKKYPANKNTENGEDAMLIRGPGWKYGLTYSKSRLYQCTNKNENRGLAMYFTKHMLQIKGYDTIL